MRRRVLAVGFSGKLGSALFALPALGLARGRLDGPGTFWGLARLDSNCSPAAELLTAGAGFEGCLRLPPKRDLLKLLGLVLRMRRLGFREAVYVGPARATAWSLWKMRLLLRLGGVRFFLGFHPLPVSVAGPSGQQRHQALLRMDRLAHEGGSAALPAEVLPPVPWLAVPEEARTQALSWLHAHPGRTGRRLVALCPGAALATNRWPLDRFIELGQRLLETGGFELLVCGGPEEAQAGARMVEAWGQGLQAAGRFSIMGSAALLEACHFMVGLDTGTTHLAAALGVPCVVLQGGRVPPGAWDPPGVGHVLVRQPVPCEGCRQAVCPLAAHPCMRALTVEAVWDALAGLRGAGPEGRP